MKQTLRGGPGKVCYDHRHATDETHGSTARLIREHCQLHAADIKPGFHLEEGESIPLYIGYPQGSYHQGREGSRHMSKMTTPWFPARDRQAARPRVCVGPRNGPGLHTDTGVWHEWIPVTEQPRTYPSMGMGRWPMEGKACTEHQNH